MRPLYLVFVVQKQFHWLYNYSINGLILTVKSRSAFFQLKRGFSTKIF